MRKIARNKNENIIIKKGNHSDIPFNDNFFDFIYMTDVIHHVPNLHTMFKELHRVLKENNFLCIVTESHKQIEKRFYNIFFPSLIDNKKNRYPDINEIIDTSVANHFIVDEIQENIKDKTVTIQDSFIKLIEEKGYSMFRQLSEEEYRNGLEKLRGNCGEIINCEGAGEILLWLKRK